MNRRTGKRSAPRNRHRLARTFFNACFANSEPPIVPVSGDLTDEQVENVRRALSESLSMPMVYGPPQVYYMPADTKKLLEYARKYNRWHCPVVPVRGVYRPRKVEARRGKKAWW